MANIEVGTRFSAIDEAKIAVREWAVEQNLSYKVVKAASAFWVLGCRSSECSFCLRISVNEDGARITKKEDHTCPHTTHQNFRQAHSVAHLAATHRSAVADNRDIAPKQIQSNERLQKGNIVTYKQAWRAREEIRRELQGEKTDTFQKIPALLDAIAVGDEETVTSLDTNLDGHFLRAFIAPARTRFAFQSCRQFLALDGTFTKAKHRLTLLIAVAIDGNNETLPVCWALVPTENKEHWTWFIELLAESFTYFANFSTAVVISDRDKGLAEAVETVLPMATHSHCCQHIADNLQASYGKSARDSFWPIAYATTKKLYEEAMNRLAALRTDAADYLCAILSVRWTTHAFPQKRYGHLTSNIVESVNAQWLSARDLPASQLLNHIWQIMMAKFYEREHRRQKTTRLTNYAYDYLALQETESRQFYAVPSDGIKAMVISAQNTYHYIVDLDKKTCTCLEFQDQNLPCKHACTACREYHLDAESYVGEAYTLEVYRKTYERSFIPFLYQDLSSTIVCKAPLSIPLRGRPPKKRRSKDEAQRTQTHKCSLCGSKEHNRRTCRQPNVQGGTGTDRS